MPLPLVGAHAVLEGMPEFNKNADMMNSKIGGIHNKLSGIGGVAQKAGGLVSGAFKAMAFGTAGAVASVGAVGGGLVKLAYDAANLPGIQSVFTNMTKSMGVDADALMGKMREASYGAVKDFDLMKSANKAMVGAGGEFGKMFAESLPTLMKVSREAAKAQGLSVEYMYDSIVTGVKRMSPMILDNLGFQFSLTDANEKYAQSVGKTTKELTKEEKQMALLNAVLKSGQELVDSTGGHIDSIQKQYQSWQTAIKNIKDQVGIALLPVLQKFMDLLGQPNQGMQDAIIRVTKSFVDWLIPAIDKVSLAISTLLNGPIAMLIKGFVGIGTSGIKTLADSIGAIFSGDFTGGFKDFGSTIEKMLTPAFGPELAKRIGEGAAKVADSLQTAFGPIRDIIGGVVDVVQDKLQLLQGSFNVFVMGIKQYFGGEKAEGIQKMMMGIRAAIVTVFGVDTYNILSKFVGWMKIAADFVVKHSDEIIGALKGIGVAIVTALTFEKVSSVATAAFGVIGKAAAGLLSPLGLITAGAAVLGIAWEKNWFGIQDKTKVVIDNIKKALPSAGEAISGLLDMLKGDFAFDMEAAGAASLKLTEGLYGIGKAFGMTDEQAEGFSQKIGDILSTISGTLAGIFAGGPDFPWEDVLPPNLADAAYKISGAIQSVTEAVGPLISTLGEAVDSILKGDFDSALVLVAQAFANIFGPDTFEAVLQFGVTLQSIFSQIGTLVGNVFSTIATVAEEVWPHIQTIIGSVWEALSVVFNIFITTILPALVSAFQGIMTWVNDNWPAIQNVIVTVFDIIATVIETVVTTVIPFAISIFQGLVDWVKENWPAIQETIQVVMEFIGNLIQIILNNIRQFWDEHGKNIMSIISLVWEWIKSTIQAAITVVQETISFVMALIRGDWGAAWEAIKTIVSTAWEWIKKTVDTAIKLLGDIIAVGWGVIKTGVEIAWDSIKLYIETAWNNIKKNVESAIQSVGKIINTEMQNIKTAWENIWNGIAGIVKNIWNQIIDWVGTAINRVIDMLNGMISAANKVPGVKIPNISGFDVEPYKLAEGGLLNKPTFVAGEVGTEVVAPLTSLMGMIKTSLMNAITELASMRSTTTYSGPQPSNVYNYGGDTYVREYNLTTQSITRPGALAMEFSAMELAYA